MSRDINMTWTAYTSAPDNDRDVIVTDGNDIDIGYFIVKERRFLCANIKEVRYWMDLPRPPMEEISSSQYSYAFYKDCRDLYMKYRGMHLDPLGASFLKALEINIGLCDRENPDFYDSWLIDSDNKKEEIGNRTLIGDSKILARRWRL